MGLIDLPLSQMAGMPHLRAGKIRVTELRILEIGLIEACMTEIGAAQVGSRHACIRQVSFNEGCARQVGIDQCRMPQRGAAEICVAQVNGSALYGTELTVTH